MAEATQVSTTEPAVAVIVVKKYANRRLYNTDTSSYITQDTLADMVRAGRDFVVYDARTGDDITRSVLTQIIVEAESKDGASMLPTPFLRQLIGFYGGNLQSVVPRYLEHAMATFAKQQQQMRQAYQQTLGPFMPFGYEEVGRQNMAMMERAMSLFTSFYRPGEQPKAGQTEADAEIDRLRAQVESLHRQLEAARATTQAPNSSENKT